MADTVLMPKLGFDMREGTLVRWVKNEGEPVNKGEVLAEIETDKATVEVESFFSGTVLRHLVEQGAVVPVGQPIAVIGQPGEKVEVPAATVEAPAAEPTPSAPADQTAISEIEAAAPSGEELEEGKETVLPGGVRASPLARRLAEESGLDLRTVKGSGPRGRITRKDVEAALQAVTAAPTPVPPTPEAPTPAVAIPLPVWTEGEAPPDREVPLTRLRAMLGRRMQESKQQAPHFYVTREYDVTKLVSLREEINALLPAEQKISINDFVVKATGLALRAFPEMNASFAGDKVVVHGHVNVGVAVPVEGGLITVVTHDTDRKPLRLLAMETRAMIERARSGKVKPEDIEGSTFSTSNLGMFDVEEFSAIINPPEAGILAVGAARKVPVVDENSGEVVVRTKMKATISVDHRVVDGAGAARFMQVLGEFLEEPMRLLV
jgi:pyruvate dehydrogenase E2 component (dihydrolipoamide acetyltransferase)